MVVKHVLNKIALIVFLFQPGEELFPTDEKGKTLFDTVDICATWEVSTCRTCQRVICDRDSGHSPTWKSR